MQTKLVKKKWRFSKVPLFLLFVKACNFNCLDWCMWKNNDRFLTCKQPCFLAVMYTLYWYDSHILHYLFEGLKKNPLTAPKPQPTCFSQSFKKGTQCAGNTLLLDGQQHANLELTLGKYKTGNYKSGKQHLYVPVFMYQGGDILGIHLQKL